MVERKQGPHMNNNIERDEGERWTNTHQNQFHALMENTEGGDMFGDEIVEAKAHYNERRDFVRA